MERTSAKDKRSTTTGEGWVGLITFSYRRAIAAYRSARTYRRHGLIKIRGVQVFADDQELTSKLGISGEDRAPREGRRSRVKETGTSRRDVPTIRGITIWR